MMCKWLRNIDDGIKLNVGPIRKRDIEHIKVKSHLNAAFDSSYLIDKVTIFNRLFSKQIHIESCTLHLHHHRVFVLNEYKLTHK